MMYKNKYILLGMICVGGILLRLFFHIGHVFSDDAYYSFLSYTLYKGNYALDYLGYPVFPLRIAHIGLTTISMKIFGANELATLIFPILFSITNIILTYKLSRLLTGNPKIALISSCLIALFPTDVIFALIGFPDLSNIFFINLGIYFLLSSYFNNKLSDAYLGGFSLFLSMQFKESSYYLVILLILLLLFLTLKEKKVNIQLIIGISFISGNYLIEGIVYLLLYNDFLYRLTVTNLNYQYSFYDFFPYTAQKLSDSKNYIRNVIDQLFLINTKSVFLRRFYLFLPIVTLIQSYFCIKRKENKLLLFWFWGTAILMIGFTTSFTEYKPLDLARSWYIYPLLMPIIILSAIFLNRFSKPVLSLLLIVYLIGSLIMCFEYQTFFDNKNLDSLKEYLRDNQSKVIYTDHFTKYSVDLIRGYENDNSMRISGKGFDLAQMVKGTLILYNQKHITELQMQKYQFPDFNILDSDNFRMTAFFGDFIFYEKVY